MSLEKYRYNTFENNNNNNCGFFKHHHNNNDVIYKCNDNNCSFEFQINHNNKEEEEDILCLQCNHECKTMKDRGSATTTSKYLLLDYSLKFEKERLKTFIDWPIPQTLLLCPKELASDGFYYTRIEDICACVFCGVTIGKWERGDTPREEHKKYCPDCPFVKGLRPVGNVTLAASVILDKLVLDGEESPLPLRYNTRGRQIPHHNNEKKFGILLLHAKPYNERYGCVLSREDSFEHPCWPKKRMLQPTPEELAEAGFFYFRLSDHVMCFHCGLGLRNWQCDSVPWEEHARHNPYCDYVLATKGQDFIDKIRLEKPLYDIRSKYPVKTPGRNKYFRDISEEDLDVLMHTLDIMKSLMTDDHDHYSIPRLRRLLRNKLKLTGLPFKSRQQCVCIYNKQQQQQRVNDDDDDDDDDPIVS